MSRQIKIAYGPIEVGSSYSIDKDVIELGAVFTMSLMSYFDYMVRPIGSFESIILISTSNASEEALYRERLSSNVLYYVYNKRSEKDLKSWLKLLERVRARFKYEILLGSNVFNREISCLSSHYGFKTVALVHSGIYDNGISYDDKLGNAVNNFEDARDGVSCILDSKAILISHQQKRGFIIRAKRFLSASMLREIDSRTRVVRTGIDLKSIKNQNNTVYDVGSFYRIDRAKGTRDVHKQLIKMRKKWKRIAVTVIGPGTSDTEKMMCLPEFDVTYRCNRASFLEIAGKTKCAIYNSEIESSPIAILEAFAVGCLPIIVKNSWSKAFLKGCEYPLVFSSLDEVYSLTLIAHERYDELYSMFFDLVKREFDANVQSKALKKAVLELCNLDSIETRNF